MVVLESWERALSRGARIHAELAGYGLSMDAEHITRPTVAGQALAMGRALESADMSTGDVGYVNAHGTATLANDAVETAAIKQVFGPGAYALPVSSTKSMHGHLLGAAGALELAATVLAIEKRVLPPTLHLVHADPECDLDYVPGSARPVSTLNAAMSNSFAFGGTNVSLVCRARGRSAMCATRISGVDRRQRPLPALEGAIHADVVVVGAGMMGLMCARTALARGQRVCLVEAETCGAGASGRSSGLITPDSELELRDLIQQFGNAEARKLWEFALGGVNAIRQAIQQDQIDCDMQVHDALFVATTRGGAQVISTEHAARNAFGYPSTLYSRESLPDILGSTAYFGALRFGDTFGIHAYQRLRRVAPELAGSWSANLRAQSGHADPGEPSRDTQEGRCRHQPSSSVPTVFCQRSGLPGARFIM